MILFFVEYGFLTYTNTYYFIIEECVYLSFNTAAKNYDEATSKEEISKPIVDGINPWILS
ncbi:hypothetical protein [Helicobacter sp.]|uniref:hypothetical protein n=1 Tax=Helicobacter sp. TaxID=218 RepID=UPI0025C5F186|nr:hypothetical protein [Helicobacter sp.]MBR2495148.1 hypothetical protein [Helicobacter sp.]